MLARCQQAFGANDDAATQRIRFGRNIFRKETTKGDAFGRLVRQRRAMWVCFVQKVEAEDDDAAVNVFQDRFNPQHSFMEGAVQRLERGPIAVFDRRDFPRVRDVVDAD